MNPISSLELILTSMKIKEGIMVFFGRIWEKIKLYSTSKPPLSEPIEGMDQLIKSLIHVESMLCQSACVAEDKYVKDAEHLMKIIKNQHVGVESVLKRMGVECKRSQVGDVFSPDIMEASEIFVLTDDKTMDEKVAVSEVPGFWLGDKIIVFEKVRLYYYQS